MTETGRYGQPTRRGAIALLGSTAVIALSAANAQEVVIPAPIPEPFSFETLKTMMEERATRPDTPPAPLENFLADLDYDGYRNIRFRGTRARWGGIPVAFQIHAFHPGWLYQEPVRLHEVADGRAQEMTFSTEDFRYDHELAAKVPDNAVLPGIAGVKINHPLNRADLFDELITFVGASYFRALGRENSYGLSARGLAIDTWLDGPEEFPRFSEFWLERPEPGQQHLVLYAALDGASVTGAYRFEIHPGADTVIEVDANLYFRKDIRQLGIAPLTSMFLYSHYSARDFNDYRPQVHDSDAVMIERPDGDVLLRPLNNPPYVAGSYFAEPAMRSFGLLQRARDYEDFQDAGARYHDRPSVMIEPVSEWGPGAVRLVEIPADLEIDDNMVLFWVPDEAPKAGESRTYRYRMHWGALGPDPEAALAWISGTRAGHGGASGVPVTNPNLRKFVIDFEGGLLGASPEDAEFETVVTASAGEVVRAVLFKVPPEEGVTTTWRLVIDIDGGTEPMIELSAHVAGFGRKLTEIWLFQWTRVIDAPNPAAEN
ncbi:MAG: glucan biosynthesis protein [Pseudomonadota bacterium]